MSLRLSTLFTLLVHTRGFVVPGVRAAYKTEQSLSHITMRGGKKDGKSNIDDDRRDRSPGIQNNFYDKSNADFKQPHGAAAKPPAPASGADQSSSAGPAPPPAPIEFGVETPMPGREEEYEAYKEEYEAYRAGQAAAGAAAGGPAASMPPPIDLRRPPGPAPGGGVGGAPAAPADSASGASSIGASGFVPRGALPGYGEESPMPGREKEYEEATKEYEEFRAQGGAEDGSADPTPPRLQFVITQPMLIELLSLGYSKAEVDTMTPPYAAAVIAQGIPAPTRAPPSPTASVGPPAQGPTRPPPGVGPPSGVPPPGVGPPGFPPPGVGPPASGAELQARVERLEVSNARLEAALSEVSKREELARREAEEATARVDALSRRLAALEMRLSGMKPSDFIEKKGK